jgi:DNA-binding MarR family transcriptional regulator
MENREPMIGALLRFGWQSVMKRVLDGLIQEGFEDLQPAYIPVLQYPGPAGVSPGTLAERCGMSKQAMNQLLHRLEESGYLTRDIDPNDHRGRIVQLTERGERAFATAHRILVALEQEWAEQLGGTRFAELKATLQELRTISQEREQNG